MERTTRTQLESLLRQFAAVTNSPMGLVWVKQPDGTLKATPGALVLDSYMPDRTRLYRVEQICTDGGGVTTPLGDHRFTAGEMFYVLRAAIDAIRMVLGEDEFHTRMKRAFPERKAA